MGALELVGSVDGAVDKLIELYTAACDVARDGGDYAQVLYPKIAVDIKEWKPIDRSQPFGYVDEAGVYSAAVSRPDLMSDYLRHQLRCLMDNYDAEISVGYSDIGICLLYTSPSPRDRG